MKTSTQGVAFVAAHEGIVTRAYRDAAGVWTIGVGHTAAAGPPVPARGMTITRDEALAIFAGDLPRYEGRVDAVLGGSPQTVFDGAVSFDFNTGAIDRATWVRRFRAGEMSTARAGLLRWTKAGGRRLAGLVRRREDEARLIFDGDYGAAPEQGADEIRAWQSDLAALGFYGGEIDGIAGPASHAAVIAYQRSHPDLVVDGIVGPATRASIARDLAARRVASAAGAAAAAAGAATAAATEASGFAHPLVLAGLAALLVLAAGAFLGWRYGSELRRLITRRKGT
jgi:lysozyme